MSQAVADLLNAALALSETERAELTELLAALLSTEASSLHPAWSAELRRRAAEVDSGSVKPIPWDEVRRQAQAQLDGGDAANG
jgi:putative addiction module component (TIGR02574 family)